VHVRLAEGNLWIDRKAQERSAVVHQQLPDRLARHRACGTAVPQPQANTRRLNRALHVRGDPPIHRVDATAACAVRQRAGRILDGNVVSRGHRLLIFALHQRRAGNNTLDGRRNVSHRQHHIHGAGP
jgi:hypothetical protein